MYVGILDAKKACDTVFQNGLFYKLCHCSIQGKTWGLIKKMYDGFECQVKVGELLSVLLCITLLIMILAYKFHTF